MNDGERKLGEGKGAGGRGGAGVVAPAPRIFPPQHQGNGLINKILSISTKKKDPTKHLLFLMDVKLNFLRLFCYTTL